MMVNVCINCMFVNHNVKYYKLKLLFTFGDEVNKDGETELILINKVFICF